MRIISSVEAAAPCRIRAYKTVEDLSLDIYRSPNNPPAPTDGVVLDLLLSEELIAAGAFRLSPLVGLAETDLLLVEPATSVVLS